MSPQLVDFDADGDLDLFAATYAGGPYLARRSDEGFAKPEMIMDAEGRRVLLSNYWDFEAEEWTFTDRALPNAEHEREHCVSAWAVDWDTDGDLDLLLGSYGGRLYLQMNQGMAEKAAFTGESVPVMAGTAALEIEGGLTAPRACDWNGDGLFDLVCGGFKGGVYLFVNGGEAGKPAFQVAQTLIPAGESTDSPLPESGVYADPIDYDGDGDLDLLVGGNTSWTEPIERSPEDEKRIEELKAEMATLREEGDPLRAKVQDAVEKLEEQGVERKDMQAKLAELDFYQEMMKIYERMDPISKELRELGAMQSRSSYLWLYRRSGPTSDQ